MPRAYSVRSVARRNGVLATAPRRECPGLSGDPTLLPTRPRDLRGVPADLSPGVAQRAPVGLYQRAQRSPALYGDAADVLGHGQRERRRRNRPFHVRGIDGGSIISNGPSRSAGPRRCCRSCGRRNGRRPISLRSSRVEAGTVSPVPNPPDEGNYSRFLPEDVDRFRTWAGG
jgi:hypothetical protein